MRVRGIQEEEEVAEPISRRNVSRSMRDLDE